MKNILTPFILIVCVHNIFGQEIRDVSLEKSVISLNFLAPGLSGEFALNKKSSIYLQGGLGFSFLVESTNGDTETEFIAQPFLLAQYRNYYNFERRSLLQKNTDFNSGNFLGFMVGQTFEAVAGNELGLLAERRGTTLGPVWGIQRNSTISFGLSLGIGLFIFEENMPTFGFNGQTGTRTESGSELTLIGSFNLGLNLSKIAK